MKCDKILKSIIIGSVFLVPFVPLVVISSFFFPFIFGKALLFRLLVEIAFGAWLILALRNKEYRPKFSWILVSALFFTGVVFLADILGVNPLKSFWSNYERMEGWVTILHSLGYLIVITSTFNSEKLWRRFLNTSVFVSVYAGLHGLLQLLGKAQIHQGGARLDASFGNASYLAVYMVIHIFIVAFLWNRRRVWNDSCGFFYGAVIILQLVNLYYTATRGAILGFIGAILLTSFLIAIFEKKRIVLKRTCWGILLTTLVFVGGFFLLKDASFIRTNPVLGRFASISLEETTTKSRFMVWDMAWEGVKERPLLGWGQENFNYVFNKNYDPGMYGQEEWFDRTHNVFFDWLIVGGFIGLFAYLSLFLTILYHLWSKKYGGNFSLVEKSLFTGLLAGYFIHNFFVFDNLTSYILFFTILGFVHGQSYKLVSLNKDSWLDSVSRDTVNKIVTPVLIALTIFSIYFFNVKGVLANRALLKAVRSGHPEGVVANLEFYKKALSYNSYANQEIREQLMQFIMKTKDVNFDSEVRKSLIELAVSEAEKEIERDPQDTRTEVFLGSLLSSYSRVEEGLEHLERGLELSPNKQSIYFEIGSIYINNGQYDKAFEILKRAYELEPRYDRAKKLYILSAIFAEKEDQVEEALGPIIDSGIDFDMNFANAYKKKGDTNMAIQILEKLVENKPDNLQYRVSLAAVYFEVGQNTKAQNEIEKAMEIDPNFKEQGEKFIEEINAGIGQ